MTKLKTGLLYTLYTIGSIAFLLAGLILVGIFAAVVVKTLIFGFNLVW